MDQKSPTPKTEIVYNSAYQRQWTLMERAEILEYVKQGKTMTWLAHKYGATLGKIAGIIYRARHSNPNTVESKPYSPPKMVGIGPFAIQRIVKQKLEVKAPRIRLRVIEHPTAVTFEQLEPHHCRWPMGDVRQSDFRFCGANKLTDGPYCEEHANLAFRPSNSKRH